MQYAFPYPDLPPLEIPDGQLSGVYSIDSSPPGSAGMDELVSAALAQPIGSPPLKSLVKPGDRVLIVVDDGTRTTRTEVMLPAVIDQLLEAGLAQRNIEVFIALGTHRPMTLLERQRKYTAQLVARHRFIMPNVQDGSEYERIGEPGGMEVRIHRALLAADFIIGVGQTVPHLIAGFGGGCKIVNPGCADPGTIGRMHWLCSTVPDGQLFAVRDNAVRARIDEVGLRAGLRFIINEVPGRDDAVAGVFAGHPVEAHREACRFARAACAVKVRELADIVISDSYPSDMDFWQSLKGLNSACSAVRPGGTVIFVTPCPEGVCHQHPELLEVGLRRSTRQIERMVQEEGLCPVVAAAIWLGSRLAARADVILVSGGVSESEAKRMGLDWAPDPSVALSRALRRHRPAPERARINVLHKAAKMICEGEGLESLNH